MGEGRPLNLRAIALGVLLTSFAANGAMWWLWQGQRDAKKEAEAALAACRAAAETVLRDVERDNEIDNRDLRDVPPEWLFDSPR